MRNAEPCVSWKFLCLTCRLREGVLGSYDIAHRLLHRCKVAEGIRYHQTLLCLLGGGERFLEGGTGGPCLPRRCLASGDLGLCRRSILRGADAPGRAEGALALSGLRLRHSHAPQCLRTGCLARFILEGLNSLDCGASLFPLARLHLCLHNSVQDPGLPAGPRRVRGAVLHIRGALQGFREVPGIRLLDRNSGQDVHAIIDRNHRSVQPHALPQLRSGFSLARLSQRRRERE